MASLMMSPEDEERDLEERLSILSPNSLASSAPMTGGRPSRQGPLPGAGGLGARGGGGFVGLDQYAAANQGTTQQFGDRVVGSVEKAGSDARGAIGSAVSGFNSAVDQGEVRDDQALRSRLSSDAAGLSKDTPSAQRLKLMRDAVYSGPSTLEETSGFSGAQTALRSARDTGELASSDSGLAELSDKSVTGNRTAGGRSFDTQLLLGNQDLRGRLDTARTGIGALEGELDAASSQSQQRAQTARTTTDATRTATRGAIGDAQTEFERALDQRTAQLREQATNRSNAAAATLAGFRPAEALPTAGQSGRYYAGNDPTQPAYADRGAAPAGPPVDPGFEQALQQYWSTPAGRAALDALLATPEGSAQFAQGMARRDVPEFIHRGAGQGMLPEFQRYLPTRVSAPPNLQALADLGIDQSDWAQFGDLTPVGMMAERSAIGTSNVNPYSFLEDYETRMGDLGRFMTRGDPNVEIDRGNAASVDDYARAQGLADLAGPQLSRRILDQSQASRAGTARTDLVGFDREGAYQAQADALNAIDRRAGAHVAGNARSGGTTWWEDYFRDNYTGSGAIATAGGPATPYHPRTGEAGVESRTGRDIQTGELLDERGRPIKGT